MASIGKFMQLAGLVLLPLAILTDLTGILGRETGLADMLLMMLFGFAVFYIGRYVEGYAANPGAEK